MKIFHKTQYRVVLLMLALLTVAAVGLVVLSSSEKSHTQVLYQELVDERQQLFAAVYNLDGQPQTSLANDYTYWDDMVSFVKHPDTKTNQTFAKENLDTALTTYHVNAIWVYQPDGKLVYQTSTSDQADIKLALTPAELKVIFAKQPTANFFIHTDQGLVELHGATITSSNDPKHKLPAQGYFMTGRLYDLTYRQHLGASLKSSVDVIGPGGSGTLPNPSTGLVVLTKSLNDQNGKTLAQLQVTSDAPSIRELYVESSRRLQNFVIIVVPTLLILLWFLTRYVTDPLNQISATLTSHDTAKLGNLEKNQTEFGQIALMLSSYFRANREQLEAAHVRLRASIDSINIGFIMTDDKPQITMVNDAARKILFNDVHRSKEVSLAELAGLLPKTELQRTIEHAISTTTSHNLGEVQFGEKFLRIFVAPVMAAPGKPPVLGSIILFEDITLERSLKRAREEFFSIASHELRTPLTVIMGNAAMINENIVPKTKDQQLGAMTQDIYDSSQRLIQMVNDFLDTSRLEQNRIKFDLEAVDLAAQLKALEKQYRHLVETEGLTLKLEILSSTAAVKVRADADKLQQVLINLLSNAVTFTHKGGITLRLESHPHYARVFVIDTGEGIPDGRHHLLFKKFQQAEENILSRNPTKDLAPGAARDTTHGTGLGLYISKLLMEGMGGLIRLESSEVGKGSVFSLTLPSASNVKKGALRAKKTATDR